MAAMTLPVKGSAAGDGVKACPTDRPTCSKCKRAWRWPRNLAYVNMDPGPPEFIKPTTKGTVVAHVTSLPGTKPPQPTMNTELFKHLELTHTRKRGRRCMRRWDENKIVKEFEYHAETGSVCYEAGTQARPGYTFARLMTLNTWYTELQHCLVAIVFNVLDHHSNFMLAVELFTQDKGDMFHTSRHMFLWGWLALLAISLAFSLDLAYREWKVKSSPNVGDLIVHCNRLDACRTFAAMVFFTFFHVESRIKDIVIRLHPWKSVQPFAAFKANGTRAFAVGYMDKCLFRVENRTGQFYGLFMMQFLKSCMFVFKLYMSVYAPTYFLVASVVSSVGSICLGWHVWQNLWADRRRLRAALLAILKGSSTKLSVRSEEFLDRQRAAAKKLLTLHFGMRFPAPAVGRSPTVSAGHVCGRCGLDALALPLAGAGQREPPGVGARVRLAHDFRRYNDAKYGPMRDGDPGTVVEVGPEVPNVGRRYLVEVDEHAGGTRSWWYDEGAIEVLRSEDEAQDRAVRSQEALPPPVGERQHEEDLVQPQPQPPQEQQPQPPQEQPEQGPPEKQHEKSNNVFMQELVDLVTRLQQESAETQHWMGGELILAGNALRKEMPAAGEPIDGTESSKELPGAL